MVVGVDEAGVRDAPAPVEDAGPLGCGEAAPDGLDAAVADEHVDVVQDVELVVHRDERVDVGDFEQVHGRPFLLVQTIMAVPDEWMRPAKPAGSGTGACASC